MSIPRYPLAETLSASLLVIALIAVLGIFGSALPGGEAMTGALVPLVLFWLPVGVVLYRRRDFTAYGFAWRDWKGGLRWALATALIVLPIYIAGHLAFRLSMGRSIHLLLGWTLVPQFFTQLLVVALPEEIFFRGYVQTLLGQRLRRNAPAWLGEQWPAILAASALFALAHLAGTMQPARLVVFFPAMLFGWLRHRTGSLIAPVLLHTLANLTVFMLEGKV